MIEQLKRQGPKEPTHRQWWLARNRDRLNSLQLYNFPSAFVKPLRVPYELGVRKQRGRVRGKVQHVLENSIMCFVAYVTGDGRPQRSEN